MLSQPNDLAITYLADHHRKDFCSNPMVMVYANTLKDHFNGKRVILTHLMSNDQRKIFESMGYEVIPVTGPSHSNIFFHRWKAIYDFLCENYDYRYVLFTDSRDILWQRDPVNDIYHRFGGSLDGVLLSDEGITHYQCEWNTKEQSKLWSIARTDNYDYSDWKIVNGGIVVGGVHAIKSFAFTMYMMTVLGTSQTTDQCYINFLYHNRERDPYRKLFLSDPYISHFAATGNTIKNHKMPFQWVDGKLVDSKGRIFALFHQWDRTEYRGEILTKHGVARI